MRRKDRERAPLNDRAIIYRDGLPAALGVIERADDRRAFLRVAGHPIGSNTPVAIELCDRTRARRWWKGVVVSGDERGIHVRFSNEEVADTHHRRHHPGHREGAVS